MQMRSDSPCSSGFDTSALGLERRRAPAWLYVALSLLLAGCAQPPAPERVERGGPTAAEALELRFIDVGQGDAVLIRTRDAQGVHTALIDAGPVDAIAERLRALGVDTIDVLIASHNHADHIGGADAVLERFPVRFYLDNGYPAATQAQQRVLKRVDAAGVTYLNATPRTLRLGSAALRIIPAPAEVGGDEQNNRSVVVRLEQGRFRALFTGDSETEELNALLRLDEIGDVDVLKAAHHGSRNGVTPAWLARTQPELVVISVGADNRYGHPNRAAIRYYCASGRRVLRTDRSGDVVIRVSTRGEYDVRTDRPDTVSTCAAATPA